MTYLPLHVKEVCVLPILGFDGLFNFCQSGGCHLYSSGEHLCQNLLVTCVSSSVIVLSAGMFTFFLTEF